MDKGCIGSSMGDRGIALAPPIGTNRQARLNRKSQPNLRHLTCPQSFRQTLPMKSNMRAVPSL
jgi:hypothetical protein